VNFSSTWIHVLNSGGYVLYNHFVAVLINLSLIVFNPWRWVNICPSTHSPHPYGSPLNSLRAIRIVWNKDRRRTMSCFPPVLLLQQFSSNICVTSLLFQKLFPLHLLPSSLSLPSLTVSVLTLSDEETWLRFEPENYSFFTKWKNTFCNSKMNKI
jgi:hypothetical protein